MGKRAALPILMALAAGLPACQTTDTGEPEVGVTSEAITGGDNFVTGLEAVCSMFVTLPVDDEGMEQDPIWCSCVKVAPQIVMTSASCVEENLTADALGDIDLRFGTSFNGGTQFTIEEVVLDRYYNPDQPTVNDIALIRLTADPAPQAAVLNERALTNDDLGPSSPDDCGDLASLADGCVVMAGFGETDNDADDFGALRKVIVPLRAVDRKTLSAGSPTLTTCAGDSGGPVFMDLGSGLEVVAVTSRRSTCFDGTVRTRVDRFLDFIYPYIDRFGATCGLDSTCETTGCPRTPDPDCDPCAWNDTCEESCPTRDRDCPLGSFPGEACEDSGDCERGGACVTAEDDDAFTYCDEPCDPADDTCQGGMVCDADSSTCVWPLPSPGSQGFPCTTGLDCRSGICEELICVNECNPGDADPCPMNYADPDSPYTCAESSVQPGTNVCLGVIFSGGGGFCTAGGELPGGELAFLLALIIGGLVIRRRR